MPSWAGVAAKSVVLPVPTATWHHQCRLFNQGLPHRSSLLKKKKKKPNNAAILMTPDDFTGV